MSVPATVVVLPVEGRAYAYLASCEHQEDEVRVACDRGDRDVVVDVLRALIALCDALARAGERAA